MPLLPGLRFIFGQIPFDERKKRADGRLAAGTAAVTARLRVGGYLLNGTKTQAETLARSTLGNVLDEKGVADGMPMVHVAIHGLRSEGNRKKNQENAPGKCNQNPTNLGYNRAAVFYCYTQTSSIATRTQWSKIGDGLYGNKDVDIYRFDASASDIGKTLTFSSVASAFSSQPVDTYLRLFNAAGTELAHSVFSFNSGLSSLFYNITSAASYYLAVSSFGNTTYSPTVANNGLESQYVLQVFHHFL